ncbi:hypothetical protein OKW96_18565 [Sphingobacterium sp. KU25419]|nr:hypothetical protein OKW96_18565 [Sphingobacterium sp. KU25419]
MILIKILSVIKRRFKKWLNENNYLRIKRVIKSKDGKKIAFEKTENLTWDYINSVWEEKNYGGIGLDTVFQAALPTPVFIKAMPTETEGEAIINEILKQKATSNLEDKERQELKEAQAKYKNCRINYTTQYLFKLIRKK